MSKSKEELDALKEEVEAVNEKLAELTPEEIAQVTGGATGGVIPFRGEEGFGFIDLEQIRITTNYPEIRRR